MRNIKLSSFLTIKNLAVFSAPLILMLVTYLAFSPAFDNEFVSWDDQFYVTDNPLIQQPTQETLKTLMTQVVSLNYHPITMISLWCNALISGVDSAEPFIATNVGIHLCNTALVFFLMMGITDRKWIVTLLTAALFGVHPMHVESVAWVSERKDVLYGFFFLTALMSYVKYVDKRQIRWIAGSFGLFAIACLSKAMAVSLVPCLFLVDYLRNRDFKTPRIYIEKIPFVLAALVTGLIAMDVQSGGDFYGLLTKSEVANALNPSIGMLERIQNAAFANTYYLKNFIYPSGFSAFHPYTAVESMHPLLTIGVSTSIIALFIAALVKGWRDVVFGLGFYMATLALVLQLIPVGSSIVAERYTYLPYIGLAYLLGLGLHKLNHTNLGFLSVLALPMILIASAAMTRTQVDIWQDHTTLFGQAVEQYPDDPNIRKYLASGLWQAGQLDSAIVHIEYAINELDLVTSSAFELLANCHADKGNVREAVAFFNEAVRRDETNVTARYHRGIQLLEIDPARAIQDFDYCEQSSNTYVSRLLYAPRGRAYGMLGQYDAALRDLEMAISLFPDDIDNYIDRAITYEYMGEKELALDDYVYVLEVDPDDPIASDRISALESARL